MIELVYMSQANHVFYDDELEELLHTAWKNNSASGITGMLLYDGAGTFIQAIEGDKHEIDRLFSYIKEDPRHEDIQILSYGEIAERNFPDWKMGFKKLDAADAASVTGYSDFLTADQQHEQAQGRNGFAIDMLNHFKQQAV